MNAPAFRRHLFTTILGVFCLGGSWARAQGAPQITFQPSSQTQGVGATAEFIVGASGSNLFYQWYFDNNAITGATNQLLALPNVQTTNGGSYQVIVTNTSGSVPSQIAILRVILTPGVTGYSYSSTITAGNMASFSIYATGQPPLTFQWDFNGVAIDGATNSSLQIPNAQPANSGSYQVFITNAYGNTNSPVLAMLVTQPPVIDAVTTNGQPVLGGTVSFSAFVQGASPLSFQWYFESNGATNAIANATNSVLVLTNLQDSSVGNYQLFVTNSYGSTNSAPVPLQLVAGSAPAIATEPSSLSAPQGFKAIFQIAASGTMPLFYQWYDNGSPITDATNGQLILPAVQTSNAGNYQVVVSNAFGAQTSTIAALTISAPVVPAPGTSFSSLLSLSASANGSNPDSQLTLGSDGYLYLMSSTGGSNNAGTISKLDTNGDVLWTVSLSNGIGSDPMAALTPGPAGILYGTAAGGGAGYGDVFSITTNGAMTLLYTFTNGSDGANPETTLALGTDGFLYGTTTSGGTNSSGSDGTIFKMSTNGALIWSVSLESTNGRDPQGGLVQGSNGVLYGTTRAGGSQNISGGGFGTVFSITTNGLLTTLYSFSGGADGGYPLAGLALAANGNLAGTTTIGGNTSLQDGLGFGTVFEITTNGALTTLADFDGTNGASCEGALVLGADGNFYGTTYGGGMAYPLGYGNIFSVSPQGTISDLFSFDGSVMGAYPAAGLVQAAPLVFYGTTSEGGTNSAEDGGNGSVFRFTGPLYVVEPPSETTLQVGSELVLSNFAFGGTPPLHVLLASNDLPGAVVDTNNNVFTFSPQCDEGNSTNAIELWVIDSSNPAISNLVEFTVVVGQCVEVGLGSGPVLIGDSTCVPVNVFSSGPITNLSFSVQTVTNRFTNWTVNAANPGTTSASVLNSEPSAPVFNFAAQPGQTLTGSFVAGYVCVNVLDAGPSVFAPLEINSIDALSPSQSAPVPAYGQDGELIVIDANPLLAGNLSITMSNSIPQLTLYGNPGTNYYIQYTTNLLAPIVWTTFTNFDLTGLQTNFYQANSADPVEFFRALSIGP